MPNPGFDSIDATRANPRAGQVFITCHLCGEASPVGLPDQAAALPVACVHCGNELDDRNVLLANLQLARVETVELARVTGLALAAFAVAVTEHPHTKRKPLETMRRTVDQIAGDSDLPSVAALAAAVWR